MKDILGIRILKALFIRKGLLCENACLYPVKWFYTKIIDNE